MKKFFQKKYALSEHGAKDLVMGILYSVLAYLSLMLPVILLAFVLNALLTPLLADSSPDINILLYFGISSYFYHALPAIHENLYRNLRGK